MMPADQIALGIEARLDQVVRHRPGTGGSDIFLAREDQFHRLLGDVGQDGRLDRGIWPDTPAVAATKKLLVNPDLIRCRLQDAGDNQAGQRAELSTGPDIGRFAVLRDLRNSIHRLHLRVVGVFGPVTRFDRLDRPAETRLHVAHLISALGSLAFAA
jgi:hypothetical protein